MRPDMTNAGILKASPRLLEALALRCAAVKPLKIKASSASQFGNEYRFIVLPNFKMENLSNLVFDFAPGDVQFGKGFHVQFGKRFCATSLPDIPHHIKYVAARYTRLS